MSEEYIRSFGRIESIIDKEYLNGTLCRTRFKMRLYSEKEARWTDFLEWFEFYGEIPAGFVGQEAMYFSTKRGDDLKNATIQIGKIKHRDKTGGICDIVNDEALDPTVPQEIRSCYSKKLMDR